MTKMKKGAAVWNVKSNSLTALSFCLNWGNLRTVLPKIYIWGKSQGSMQKSCLLPPTSMESISLHQSWFNKSQDVQIWIWGAVVFAGKQAQLPAVKRVLWKGLHIRLTPHPTTHRKNVLSISECPPWRVTASSCCKEAPVLTLRPHHREQCGKSLLVRGPLEFLVPERRLSICIQFLKSFSWCTQVDEGSYITWSRDSGPKTCLSGPNSSPQLFILLLPVS